jgi:RimJ/RimL family protein N-acetyltransferase
MAHPFWPLFDLRITTPRLEIRLPTDDDLVVLAELASQGVHDPATMPFLIPWTDQASPALERGILQWGWEHRAAWTSAEWSFNGVVVVDGEIVGVQDLKATSFSVLRTVATGSWLGHAHQGRGIGTEMRTAILHLAFEGLGA